MESEIIINRSFKNKELQISPACKLVDNFVFPESEEDEAALCHFIAKVGGKAGMNANDFQYLFPAILRMLKSDTSWSQNK